MNYKTGKFTLAPGLMWLLRLHMQQEQTRRSHRGGGSALNEQWSEDLPQHVHIQAIAGLGHLGKVREEVLQGEAVMKRDGGGGL